MNVILLLFIILATMFIASGLTNVITVINGTDYYMEQAGIGDYIIITSRDGAIGNIEKVLEKEPVVKDYRIEPVVFGTQNNITRTNGDKVKTRNEALFQSIQDSKIAFFDSDNVKVTKLEQGQVYVTGNFMNNNNIKVGDSLNIEYSGVEMTLVVAGKVKDALLGSDFMGNTRFILSEEDMQKMLDNEEIRLHYQGEIAYIDTDDVSTLSSATKDIPNVTFSGAASMIKLCYVMDMIVAFIVLILSICLIIVSFVVLKFSITFTISEEFREIGVMKAIGLTNRKIRSIYIGKYLMLAVVGTAIGFLTSIPFGNVLMKSVSDNMVLGNYMGVSINFIGALLVVSITILFAYFCTRKVKKSSPLDAIRTGQTGERYKKKTIYRIGRSHTSTSLYMAINDVISSPRRFLTIIISFFVCTLFVLILVNTTATMKSSNLIYTFGTKSDLYITNIDEAMKYMGKANKSELEQDLLQRGEDLTRQGIPSKFCIEVLYKYTISFKGNDYSLTCQQGLETKSIDYKYTEGLAPINKKEIAITPQISKKIGATIGDTVTIDFGDEKLDCMVTAYYETMNLLGEVIRLHESAPTDLKYCSSIMQYQINFTDHPSADEIEVRKEKIKAFYGNEEVMNATEYCIKCIGVVDTMEAVQYMLLGITLVVVLLITILMERAFIADEKSQIAILKAIGFKNKEIYKWHTFRFGIVALISVAFAAVFSVPLTNLCITPIFGMMGARDIQFNIEPLQIFVIYPGIVVIMTLLIAWITVHYTKTIKSSDTANIE